MDSRLVREVSQLAWLHEVHVSRVAWYVALVMGLAPLLLGMAVMMAWHFHKAYLIQLRPFLAPMQYNAALGFALAGGGVVALACKEYRTGRILGLLVLTLGGLTLAEYLMPMDFGIDQFFMQHYITTLSYPAGRMAPSTAICFILAGLSLVILSLERHVHDTHIRILIPVFLIFLIFTISALTLTGYLVGYESYYGWSVYTRMAPHTAVGFLMVGMGLYHIAWDGKTYCRMSLRLLVTAIFCIAAFLFNLFQPMSVAAGITYASIVLCSMWFSHAIAPLLFAGVGSGFVLLGYLSAPDWYIAVRHPLANNAFAIVGIWITAAIALVQKRATAYLRRSEATRKAFVDASGDGYWDWYLKDDYQYMSPRFWEILGYRASEKRHHPNEWKALIFREDLNVVMYNLKRHIETKGKYPFEQEVRYRHKDGSTVIVLCKGHVVQWDRNGKPVRMIGTYTDITRLKQLEISEENFRAAMECAVVGMALVSPDGQWLKVNKSLCQMLGYSEEECASLDFRTIAHPEDADYERQYMQQILGNEIQTCQLEKRYLTKDGAILWGLLSLSLVRNRDGSPKYFIFQIQDITRRKQVEENLKERDIYLETIIENMPSMVFVKDAEELRFVRFNKAGEKLTGLSREELLGKNDYDFFPKEQADFFTGIDREVLASGQLRVIEEEELDTPLGKKILCTKKVAVALPNGKRFLLGISEDITKYKEIQARLMESEQFHQLITESNPDLICVKDKEFKIISANKAFLNVYPEHMRDKVIGHTTLSGYDPREAAVFLAMDRKAFKEGYSESLQTITFPDGKARTLYTRKIRFENAKGEPFLLAISRDVDEQEAMIARIKTANRQADVAA